LVGEGSHVALEGLFRHGPQFVLERNLKALIGLGLDLNMRHPLTGAPPIHYLGAQFALCWRATAPMSTPSIRSNSTERVDMHELPVLRHRLASLHGERERTTPVSYACVVSC
jgi:hypothetical protein